MICEAASMFGNNLFSMWLVLTFLGLTSCLGMSSLTFAKLYWNPSYDVWRFKCNPKFPKPEHVRTEILLTIKCISLSTMLPALSLYLAAQGKSQAFCGWGGRSVGWHLGSLAALIISIDFFEWGYHYLGHQVPAMWKQHKSHHKFYNPTPFSVIADEAVDQLVRTMPMLLSVIMPINMDVLFGLFAVMFYAYGVYLHSGYELAWPDAHHPIINTSFQHYLHHAEGAVGKPRHTGFFIKLWDQLADGDSTAHMLKSGKCTCSKCCRERGERSIEAWKKVEKVDYSCLLSPKFWFQAFA
ncbi:Lathosterol oxidase (C-5 sterol desaturase) (Delta(7)-sterol 5-desaturase) (Delta(7)-sterol C5(6)-desaturase) (Lathosterol 5-desaturase) (Sterol-C5-desaturase) [Durusdinium trenchii]|uniref:Lathosterol oxidase (C-5 sterol desaturase) (Delta(7)-sterol 5-desaturase) (Delta(7)-sterol C5(6)-desaturase) (Lathosterol 5-desaturase) (Sterol-C5-desaturase) n=2 Tax=Durusdinium trenchii TaxID=1381693 RepID=A0ABP0QCR2_9DINO